MRYVIVGNGAAAVLAAETLLKESPGATVEVYGEEPYLAYRRPQLPEYLAGGVEESRVLIHPAEWYAEKGIAVHRGVRVDGLDPQAGTIHLAGGGRAGYDRLLLATGSTAFIPQIAGADVPGFFSLRTLEDARRIREYAAGREYAVVIGGGLLGLESARGLRALGLIEHISIGLEAGQIALTDREFAEGVFVQAAFGATRAGLSPAFRHGSNLSILAYCCRQSVNRRVVMPTCVASRRTACFRASNSARVT